MSQNPINLLVRFLLEIAGLVGLFRLGLWLADGAFGILLAVALTAIGVGAWATFNVPGDRSRSGRAPVRVHGGVRLAVELAVLGGGAVGWWLAGPLWLARVYTVVLVLHYALSWDRVVWLLSPETNVVAGTSADIE